MEWEFRDVDDLGESGGFERECDGGDGGGVGDFGEGGGEDGFGGEEEGGDGGFESEFCREVGEETGIGLE